MYHLTEVIKTVRQRSHPKPSLVKREVVAEAKKMRKGQNKWIQGVVESPEFRHGAFTKKATAAGHTVKEHVKHVLAHPENYDLRTRRQAQFLANIQH